MRDVCVCVLCVSVCVCVCVCVCVWLLCVSVYVKSGSSLFLPDPPPAVLLLRICGPDTLWAALGNATSLAELMLGIRRRHLARRNDEELGGERR